MLKKFIFSCFGLAFILLMLVSVSASVNLITLNYNADNSNYDYAVIGKTYTLYVAGNNLAEITNSSELIPTSFAQDLVIYTFTPNNNAGLRTFTDSNGNSFQISVLSDANELANSFGDVTIEINDHSSSVSISGIEFSDKTIRIVNLSEIPELKENSISGSLELDKILNGFEFNLDFTKGEKYPIYNSLFIDGGSSAGSVVNSILIYNNIKCGASICEINQINTDPSLLNPVLDKYNANFEYPTNAKAIKNGNSFYFYSEEGYADLNGTYLENIQSIIDEKIKYINPDEVINALLPIQDFSEFKKFVDFEISVDSTGLSLSDGEYVLKILYEDRYGNTGEFPITLNLEITNNGNPQNENNGTIEFNDTIISQTLNKVENLPSGVSLTVVLYGKNLPIDSGFVSSPSNVDVLNFIQINSSNTSLTDDGSFDLYFKVLKTSIPSSDKNSVRLYVQEGTAWRVLTTRLFNESATSYEYKAIVPHFSNFMIAVLQDSSSSSSNEPYQEPGRPGKNNTQTINTNPLVVGDSTGEGDNPTGLFSGITGAVIGALTTPGGIILSLVFIIAIIILILVLKKGRKENKKQSKENSENVENEIQEEFKSEELKENDDFNSTANSTSNSSVSLKENKSSKKSKRKKKKSNSKKKRKAKAGGEGRRTP